MVLKVLFSKFLMLKRHFQGGVSQKNLKKVQKSLQIKFFVVPLYSG